jgi:hypothetical protein
MEYAKTDDMGNVRKNAYRQIGENSIWVPTPRAGATVGGRSAAEAKPAKAPRQGSAMPLTACQISHDVMLTSCLCEGHV